MPALPFKLNQDRRRHIPEQKRKVVNWREYDESLRRRGGLTVWFSDEVIEAWKASPRTGRGGRPADSDLAVLTGLTLKAVFRLAYRQTEGLIGSLMRLLGLDLPVPDHTTLCRRAETLEVPRPKPRGDGAGGGAGRDTGPMHLRKLLKKQMRAPRVMITDKLASYNAARGEVMPSVEHRRHK